MKFKCEPCEFETNSIKDYKRHKNTVKHFKITTMVATEGYDCVKCGNRYTNRMSLWRHNQTCHEHITIKITESVQTQEEPYEDAANNVFKEIHNELHQITKSIITSNDTVDSLNKRMDDLNAKIDMLINKKHETVENNYNGDVGTVNSDYSVKIYLNTECKDAITLPAFIKSIEIPMEMTKKSGELTYDTFMANVFRENIKKYAITERPIHVSDEKRKTYYIKSEEGWIKDKGEGMRKIHYTFYKEQMNNLSSWGNEDTLNWKEPEKTALAKANKMSFGPEKDEEFERLKHKALGLCNEMIKLPI